MSDFSATVHNPFDETRPYLLSLYMTLVGYSVLVALPAINSAWVDQLGFTDVEVNRVASADLLGLFLGSVAAAFSSASSIGNTSFMQALCLRS